MSQDRHKRSLERDALADPESWTKSKALENLKERTKTKRAVHVEEPYLLAKRLAPTTIYSFEEVLFLSRGAGGRTNLVEKALEMAPKLNISPFTALDSLLDLDE